MNSATRALPAYDLAQVPPDITTMRATVCRLLGPDDGPDLLPPSSAEVDTLTVILHGHLEVLLPELERAVVPRPKNVAGFCALACVGEARRKLTATPCPALESRVAHARRLARSLKALCDHWERLDGQL